MDHRFLKTRMFLYLDGNLSDQEYQQCRGHVNECAQCCQQLEALASVWQAEADEPVVVPSVRLKARLESTIRGKAIPQPIQTPFMERLAFVTRPALMMATLIIGVLIGTYLGRISTTLPAEAAPIASNEMENELAAPYIESFQDLPPESVGRAYMMVTVDE